MVNIYKTSPVSGQDLKIHIQVNTRTSPCYHVTIWQYPRTENENAISDFYIDPEGKQYPRPDGKEDIRPEYYTEHKLKDIVLSEAYKYYGKIEAWRTPES